MAAADYHPDFFSTGYFLRVIKRVNHPVMTAAQHHNQPRFGINNQRLVVIQFIGLPFPLFFNKKAFRRHCFEIRDHRYFPGGHYIRG